MSKDKFKEIDNRLARLSKDQWNVETLLPLVEKARGKGAFSTGSDLGQFLVSVSKERELLNLTKAILFLHTENQLIIPGNYFDIALQSTIQNNNPKSLKELIKFNKSSPASVGDALNAACSAPIKTEMHDLIDLLLTKDISDEKIEQAIKTTALNKDLQLSEKQALFVKLIDKYKGNNPPYMLIQVLNSIEEMSTKLSSKKLIDNFYEDKFLPLFNHLIENHLDSLSVKLGYLEDDKIGKLGKLLYTGAVGNSNMSSSPFMINAVLKQLMKYNKDEYPLLLIKRYSQLLHLTKMI